MAFSKCLNAIYPRGGWVYRTRVCIHYCRLIWRDKILNSQTQCLWHFLSFYNPLTHSTKIAAVALCVWNDFRVLDNDEHLFCPFKIKSNSFEQIFFHRNFERPLMLVDDEDDDRPSEREWVSEWETERKVCQYWPNHLTLLGCCCCCWVSSHFEKTVAKHCDDEMTDCWLSPLLKEKKNEKYRSIIVRLSSH